VRRRVDPTPTLVLGPPLTSGAETVAEEDKAEIEGSGEGARVRRPVVPNPVLMWAWVVVVDEAAPEAESEPKPVLKVLVACPSCLCAVVPRFSLLRLLLPRL